MRRSSEFSSSSLVLPMSVGYVAGSSWMDIKKSICANKNTYYLPGVSANYLMCSVVSWSYSVLCSSASSPSPQLLTHSLNLPVHWGGGTESLRRVLRTAVCVGDLTAFSVRFCGFRSSEFWAKDWVVCGDWLSDYGGYFQQLTVYLCACAKES